MTPHEADVEFNRLVKLLCLKLHEHGIERTPIQVMQYLLRCLREWGHQPTQDDMTRILVNTLSDDLCFLTTAKEI